MSYGPAGATAHESGIGDGDSGGGVFIKNPITHTWQLAGISLYKDNYGTAPDKFKGAYAARIFDYLGRLNATLTNVFHDMLPGDLDGDGKVTLDDYITLKAKFGDHVTAWTQGDFNGDGLLGFDELLAIQATLGPDIPEPATLSLLALGGLALMRRRKLSATARKFLWRRSDGIIRGDSGLSRPSSRPSSPCRTPRRRCPS